MIDISVTSNIKEISKKLSDLAYRQIPFATATALTALGKTVQAGEQKAMGSVFDRPTPFTVNSVGVRPARKDNLEVIVFVKDIAATYLAPYEFGGSNKLNSKALLKPVDTPLNRYGNMPRNKLAQLIARPDVFVGTVKTKSGEAIDGIWQRAYMRGLDTSKGGTVAMRKKLRGQGRQPRGANTTGHLKLLVRFSDAHPIKQHLDYRKRAEMLIRTNFNREMGQALARAIATAK